MRSIITRGACVALAGGLCGAALAAQVGFVEDFNDDAGDFSGGAQFISLETSGGVGGAGDGFLRITNEVEAFLGSRSTATELTGDLTADGVTGFSLWLKDFGTTGDLQIHVGVGSSFTNFWLYTIPFVPGTEWSQFYVDITSPADWVQTHGVGGSFADALANSDRFLVRHDLAPFTQNPDVKIGDFGLDRVAVLPEPAGMATLLLGALALIRRR